VTHLGPVICWFHSIPDLPSARSLPTCIYTADAQESCTLPFLIERMAARDEYPEGKTIGMRGEKMRECHRGFAERAAVPRRRSHGTSMPDIIVAHDMVALGALKKRGWAGWSDYETLSARMPHAM